jgi:hypothetical protein
MELEFSNIDFYGESRENLRSQRKLTHEAKTDKMESDSAM